MIDELGFKTIFKNKLRYYMTMRGVTQSDLSKLSGVSQTTIKRYLDGTRTASAYCVAKIAKALGCNISDLTGC